MKEREDNLMNWIQGYRRQQKESEIASVNLDALRDSAPGSLDLCIKWNRGGPDGHDFEARCHLDLFRGQYGDGAKRIRAELDPFIRSLDKILQAQIEHYKERAEKHLAELKSNL